MGKFPTKICRASGKAPCSVQFQNCGGTPGKCDGETAWNEVACGIVSLGANY